MLRYLSTLKNKKAFTLVEVIIVLVILAILAAVLIPSLTGYIDDANEKTLVSEAKRVFQAAQTAISEVYATRKSEFVAYLKTKKMTVKTPAIGADGQIKRDAKGNIIYNSPQKTGRISNSSFRVIQYNTGFKSDNYLDEELARKILKYLESENLKDATYKFNVSNTRLGTNAATSTAEGYFKTNAKDDVAITIYYNEKGKVLMVHFAKRGINKIVEVAASGIYAIVDSVLVTA